MSLSVLILSWREILFCAHIWESVVNGTGKIFRVWILFFWCLTVTSMCLQTSTPSTTINHGQTNTFRAWILWNLQGKKFVMVMFLNSHFFHTFFTHQRQQLLLPHTIGWGLQWGERKREFPSHFFATLSGGKRGKGKEFPGSYVVWPSRQILQDLFSLRQGKGAKEVSAAALILLSFGSARTPDQLSHRIASNRIASDELDIGK